MRIINWDMDRWKPRFFAIWSGQALSLFGSQILQFALVWWLTETTGSATVLAFASIAALIPHVVVAPFAGALVDRWDRRKVMIFADSGIALAALGLALLFGLNIVKIWHIYAVLFVRAAAGSFHWTAMFASTSMMVPDETLSRIAGLNSALQGSTSFVSPLVGAFALAILSMPAIIAIDVVTAVLGILPLLFISIPQPAPEQNREKVSPSTLLREIGEGIQYVRSQTGLLLIILIAIFLNFFAFPAFTLLPLYVTQYFGRQAIDFGVLQSVTGAGMIAGGLLLASWKAPKRRIATSLFGIILQGAGMVMMGLTPVSMFWLAIASLLVISLLNPISNGLITATFQSIIPHEKQGRVWALISSGTQLMSPLGLMLAGPVADTFGVNAWFILAGGVSIVLGFAALFIPPITNLDIPSSESSSQAPLVRQSDGTPPETLDPYPF